MNANQLPGMPELEAAANDLSRARYAYDRASDHGYPVREAQAVSEAEAAYKPLLALYPASAAYRKAASWERASNYAKSAAGRKACGRILAGEEYAMVLTEMESEWSGAAQRAVNNS